MTQKILLYFLSIYSDILPHEFAHDIVNFGAGSICTFYTLKINKQKLFRHGTNYADNIDP